MRKIINTAEVSENTIKLQQLGAKIQVINSTMCYVNFELDGLTLQYVYNMNRRGNYFLERTKPYPLAIAEFTSENDLVKLIKSDLQKFKNALKLPHIEKYITIAKLISTTFTSFEDTFLNYDIPDEKVDKIYKKILALNMEIDVIQELAKESYEKDNNE